MPVPAPKPIEVVLIEDVEDEYEDVVVEEVEDVEVEEEVMVEKEIEVEEEVEVEKTVEEVEGDDVESDTVDMEDKFVALLCYPDFRPFVITFLKMSAKSKDFDAEAEDANEIITSLACSEVESFDVLEAIVKKVVISKSVSLSALMEALKNELPIAYGSMSESRFTLFVGIVKEHFFGTKAKPRKVQKVIKMMERRKVKRKTMVPEKKLVKKQKINKVKKRVKKSKLPSVSNRRDPGASEPRVNPRDPRLRRDSGAAEPRPGNPRDPRLQRMKNQDKSTPPPVMELSGWVGAGGAKPQTAQVEERIADPIIENFFMSSPPREPTPPPPPQAPSAPTPLTQGALLNTTDKGREDYSRELDHEFRVDVLVTKTLKRFQWAYLVCYAPLRPEMVADCNTVDIVVDPWVLEKTGNKTFNFHYLSCNLIIVRAFNKLQQELELRKTLTIARGFYPNLGKNQAPPMEKRIDPSFQIQRQCRVIFSHPAKVYLIGANRRGETFFMAPRGTGITDGGGDVLVKAVALPEKIRTHMSRYNENCFVADNLGLITRDHMVEMQELLNLMISVKVAKDLGLPDDEQKDLGKVDEIIKNLVKAEFNIPSVIGENDHSVPEPAASKKEPTAAQVFNIKRERNPSDGRKSNSSAETSVALKLTKENLEQLHNLLEVRGAAENATVSRNSPPQQQQQQKQAEVVPPEPEEEEYIACGELPEDEEEEMEVAQALSSPEVKSSSPGPSSRELRGKRKRSSAYSSPSPIPESKQGSLQWKRRRETAEEENDDEEHSWRRELMRNRDRGGGGDDGELDLDVDRLLSDQRDKVYRSRSPSGSSRERASQERHPSSGRNAGNITDGFVIPGLGRGKLPYQNIFLIFTLICCIFFISFIKKVIWARTLIGHSVCQYHSFFSLQCPQRQNGAVCEIPHEEKVLRFWKKIRKG